MSAASAAVCSVALWASVNMSLPYSYQQSWFPQVGLTLSFLVDHFALFFIALISGIGSAVFAYCAGYFANGPVGTRTVRVLALFSLSMLGLVLSDNLLLLFIFWELTSISSYFLIGTKSEKKEAREAALRALLVTVAGGMAMLLSFILLFTISGTLELTSLADKKSLIQSSSLYPVILILIGAGAFTKSAQFPFHFWLPGSMAAPSPVSAFLHSATMVKAGIYLLARFHPILGGTELWHYLFTGIGATTMLLGAIFALTKTDLKALLAYTTVSALGMLTFLVGLGTTLALKAALIFLFVHACYKAALFMVVGSIEKASGTRELSHLRGLGAQSPTLWCAALLPALSMCGVPPMLGFIGKELIYEAKLQAPAAGELYLLIGFLTNALTVTAALLVGVAPFSNRRNASTLKSRLTLPLLLPPIALGIISLVLGLVPTLIGESLLEPSFQVLMGEPSEIKLTLWHGINPILALSILTIASGIAGYWIRDRFTRGIAKLEAWLSPFSPERTYSLLIKKILNFASIQARVLQNGCLNSYLTITFCYISLLLLVAFFSLPEKSLELPASPDFRFSLVILGIVVAVLLSIRASLALEAVLYLGVVGIGVTLFFVFFGAPDVALTQFLVELLLLVLIVAVSARLPAFRTETESDEKVQDLLIASILGIFLSFFVLQAILLNEHQAVSEFYARTAVPEAFGHNVVNVILVDFRALDTLGELTVLAVAIVGVASLLGTRSLRRRT